MKSAEEIEDAKLAIHAMLTAGTPISKIHSLLIGDGFTEKEVDSLLAGSAGFHGYSNAFFKHRVVNGAMCAMGFGTFIYYFFAYRSWSIVFTLPLAMGVWGALNLFRGPRFSVERKPSKWDALRKPDERHSFIKKRK